MATFSKPTVVPNWATTSGNVSVPSAGKRNDGWLSTEIPASDIENWNKRTVGEWLEWLDERLNDGDGVGSTGSLSCIAATFLAVGVDTDTFVLDDGTNPAVTFIFDDDASVSVTDTTRAIAHGGTESVEDMRDLTVTAINAAPTLSIAATPGALHKIVVLTNSTEGVAGNVAVTETVADAGFLVAGMTGGIASNDELILDVLALTITGALDIDSKRILALREFIMDDGKDFRVQGAGRYKHGDIPIQLSANLVAPSANITHSNGFITITANSAKATLPLILPVGKTITKIDYAADGGDAGSKTFRFGYRTASGSNITSSSISDSTSGVFTASDVDIEQEIVAGRFYFLEMEGSAGSTTDKWNGAAITILED